MNDFEKLEDYYFTYFSKRDLVHDYVSLMRAHYGDESIVHLSEYICSEGSDG